MQLIILIVLLCILTLHYKAYYYIIVELKLAKMAHILQTNTGKPIKQSMPKYR